MVKSNESMKKLIEENKETRKKAKNVLIMPSYGLLGWGKGMANLYCKLEREMKLFTYGMFVEIVVASA